MPGFIITVVGVFLACFPGLIQSHVWSRGAVRAWGWVIATFAAILSAVSIWATYSEYSVLVFRLKTGRYEVAEGVVENYKQDRSDESFTVNGARFEYSDARISSAFNNTAAAGGPIRPDLIVRIAHADGKILRLEIRK